MVNTDASALLARKLCSLNGLKTESASELALLPFRYQRLRSGTVIVQEGQQISECCLLVSGYACRSKLAKDGGRQIVSFHFPGDILDIQHLWFAWADHNVQIITDADVAFVSIRKLRSLVEERPDIGTALWRNSLIDASVFREWVLNVGRRDAKTRIAHMLCEFVSRGHVAGLGEPQDQLIPLTQEQIGDATGLTSVHVNRMLRQLKGCGALAGPGHGLHVADWDQLKRIATFSAGYLHAA